MDNFLKSAMNKDYESFRSQARTYMTKKLCTDQRIMDYMEKKEKYQAMADSARKARDAMEKGV